MSELDIVKLVMDSGVIGVLLTLYVQERNYNKSREEQHDKEFKEMGDKRVEDIKFYSRTPTNLGN